MVAFRILSLDGGGVRGVLTAALLERLESEVPFLAMVDLFAGTSTGGIIALGLADGMAPGEIKNLYIRNGKRIFSDTWLDDVADLGRIIGAEYGNSKLNAFLRRSFGRKTLGDLPRHVLIPAFDLDNEGEHGRPRHWKAKFFHNFSGPGDDRAELIVDVAMATSAGPAYFPTYKGYIDGGVVVNNPSVAALAQVLDDRYPPRVRLRDIRLLSVGTGISGRYVAGQTHDWGYAQWAKPLLSLMIDGGLGVADYQCRQLLTEKHYRRLAPFFKPGITVDLDDVGRVGEMLAMAQTIDIADVVSWLRAW